MSIKISQRHCAKCGVKTYYNSEKITVANISVNLPEGEYVLVFDNTVSGLSNKAVTANVEMRW